MKTSNSEDKEQMAFVQWMTLNKIPFFHIPNGGKRERRLSRTGRWICPEGAKLKRMGVQPGVPDICIPLPLSGYHGLYIEFKTQTGVVSREQRWWLETLNEAGYLAVVARPDWVAAVKITEEYLGGGKRKASVI